jgi:hypothetical protein
MGAYPFVLIVPIFAITGERPNNAVVGSWGLTFLAIAGALLARLPSDGQHAATEGSIPVGSPR